jgi:hypothetical protein
MGMRVGGGGGGWANHQTSSSVNSHQQRQQGVKNLFTALQSGDENAAQTAFTALQNQGLPANSPINAIGQALQTGDLASAQKAAQGVMASRGRHGGGVHGNDGDADGKSAQSSAAAPSASSTSTAASTPTDPAVAFTAFMQTLEASLELQNPNASSAATASTASASGSTATPSTQSVLWSQGSGFTQATSTATLKADLDSLIQQMTADASASLDPASFASATSASALEAAATSTANAPPAVQSTASALQSSFTNLMGTLGGQASSASVMNFLKSLDAGLSNSASSLNVSA